MRTEQGPQWLLIMVGVGVAAWGVWQGRRAWRGRNATTGPVPGLRLIDGAWALAALGAGLCFVLIGVGAVQAVSTTALVAWTIAGVVGLVGALVRLRERRQDWAMRRELGLSTKRRRLHPLLVGFVVYMSLAMVGSLAMVAVIVARARPGLPVEQPSPTMVLSVLSVALVGGALATAVQPWRRIARDREIQNAGRVLTDLPALDPPRKPQQVLRDTGRGLVAMWTRPCPPQRALESVIGGVAIVLAGGLLSWAFAAGAAETTGPSAVANRVLGFVLAGVVAVGTIVATAYIPDVGLVSAIKQLLARSRTPGPEDEG